MFSGSLKKKRLRGLMMKLFVKTMVCLLFCGGSFVLADVQQDIKSVRQNIHQATEKLKNTEQAQKKTAENLAKIRQEVDKLVRELNDLATRQNETWANINQLQKQLENLQKEVADTKAQVSRLLLAHYKYPSQTTAVFFLQQDNANEKSRLLNYARYMNQYNAKVVAQLKQQQNELSAQENKLQEEKKRVDALIAKRQEKIKQLGINRSKTDTINRQLDASIAKQKNSLLQLRAQERALNEKLKALSKKSAQSASTLTDADRALKQPNDTKKPAKSSSKKLALLRPISGGITGAFGTKQNDGRTRTYVFMASAPQAVRAAAAGKVVLLDENKVMGRFVAIDHGQDWVSIYGALSAVNVAQNTSVAAGQVIGTSGEFLEGPGLYFALYHNGTLVNPAPYFR